MTEFTPQQLERWAEIIADRADRMPLRIVYMFDKPRLHDRSHCLGLAFEMDGSAPTRMVDRWAIMSVAELADLGAKLGISVMQYANAGDKDWLLILEAAKVPKLTLRKVCVVPTP
jgi:hypothetical protein